MAAESPEQFSLALPPGLVETIARRAAELVLEQLQTGRSSESPYLTIPEAATYARCKRQRIDDLLSSRRLSRYKDGRRTLVLRAELDALLVRTTGPRRPAAACPALSAADSISAADRATVTNPDNIKPS